MLLQLAPLPRELRPALASAKQAAGPIVPDNLRQQCFAYRERHDTIIHHCQPFHQEAGEGSSRSLPVLPAECAALLPLYALPAAD